MSNQLGFIDIILLAMFAGFILLRLRNILGRKTGHQGKAMSRHFPRGMQTLKDIENSSGRDRNSPKFSSRTLDIDIVLQLSDDEEILFESDEIAKYRFVSEPLEEIL